jgi:hypothetical protein
LAFENNLDESHACACWGPSFTQRSLVERDEYFRCWELICLKPWKYILLRGTKGIGKSVFLYWLINKIVEQAVDANSRVPSFLLIVDEGGQAQYNFLTVENGTPVVRLVGSRAVSADYVLSDIVHDSGAVTTNWNLNVISYGSFAEPKQFMEKVDDAKQVYKSGHHSISYLTLTVVLDFCTIVWVEHHHESMHAGGAAGHVRGRNDETRRVFIRRLWWVSTHGILAQLFGDARR